MTDVLSSVLAGLAEWEVLTWAVGEQVGGGGVCDGAADSHGKKHGEYLLLWPWVVCSEKKSILLNICKCQQAAHSVVQNCNQPVFNIYWTAVV